MTEKKERKYYECFRSNRSGSCNHCKIRGWDKGYKIYGKKMPDGRWAVCTDKKCYLEQGGTITIFKGIAPKKEQPQPETPVTVNKHTPLNDNQHFACLDCGVSRILYLWKHDNHNIRTLKDEEQ